jgi:hypothetical protein
MKMPAVTSIEKQSNKNTGPGSAGSAVMLGAEPGFMKGY